MMQTRDNTKHMGCGKMLLIFLVIAILLSAVCAIISINFYDCDAMMAKSASGRILDSEWPEYRERCLR